MKQRFSVFASGTGSNFDAMMQDKKIASSIVLLVCDKPGAAVIKKAQGYGVETLVLEPKRYASKQEYEKVIAEKLQDLEVEWIFLAGYMRLIGETLLSQYEGRIVNIHPSLLPDFPGKDAIGQAYRAGVSKTGVTIHYVDEGMDTGPIIAQEEIERLPEETEEQLKTRIQAVEHRLYPNVINQLMQNVTEEL
ncbi:phosphoribosylglycinamide formyltransferase [Oceanobacillus oncorhynchi subsp. incaldanensis]|uniref:Phosphoribosylglycinamide formyltransferase n=2 Tax=Oceanobacillus TaxID=182709 RepID=A0A0A1MIM8_9BACI|nr:phosphoribosylglycinamide formyltransferase [Oceanobacillus oncorhynchi]MDM8100650.1 phosphoribosylglycinamide formyltransferase [Oceanobacillus oncorhynchi]UUI41489.1 phosphoribosylglycinamide formyltransferase [Oceanobacillus oncorhynchi]GIO17550.1 phosphoribosylglycinamide formyltransferase [Oceanobacillus oncorhynchi subsp. incaldanensis]CEI82928.1 Phosphoribosylglycinamide formyltransferase [Oceanobacillus oncorhynchi]